MARIDELITDIHTDEAIELDGYLEKDQQRRMEDRILAAIMEEEFADVDRKETVSPRATVLPGRKKSNRKKLFVFGLAAVLVLGLGLTVLGASRPDWDIELIRAMGLDHSNTLQLESGEVQIHESDVCDAVEYKEKKAEKKTVTITALNSIGDKNSAFIRLSTDYPVPEFFDESINYIIPENSEICAYEKDPEKAPVTTGMGSTLYSIAENGYLNFIVEIADCQNLNKSYVTIHLENLYLYREEEGKEKKELLLEGCWDLKWKYEYKSNVKTYYMMKSLTMQGEKYYVNKIEISPVSVTIYGFRMPWDRTKEYDNFVLDAIFYQDGSEQKIGENQVAGCKNRMLLETFVGIQFLGEPIDTKNVEAIMISGHKID